MPQVLRMSCIMDPGSWNQKGVANSRGTQQQGIQALSLMAPINVTLRLSTLGLLLLLTFSEVFY